jgi:hypothetical protein
MHDMLHAPDPKSALCVKIKLTRPYSAGILLSIDDIELSPTEAFSTMVDKNGNTVLDKEPLVKSSSI